MKKKILLISMFLLMSLSLSGCSTDCRESGCDDPIYQETGYCKYHAMKHEVLGMAKDFEEGIKKKVNAN